MFSTSIAARFLVTFLKQNQFFEPSREVLLGRLFFLRFLDVSILSLHFLRCFCFFPIFFFDPLISLYFFILPRFFFFRCVPFHLLFLLRFFSSSFFFKFLPSGRSKGNARDGRSRHPPTDQPTEVFEFV